MATLENIVNVIPSSTLKTKGTGTKGNAAELTNTKTLLVTEHGFTFDSAQEFSEAYLKTLIKQKKLIVINGIVNFAPEAQDDDVETFEDGTEKVQRTGLFKFKAEFVKGLHFNTAIATLSSFKDFDVSFVDRDGNILLSKDRDGKPKGMSVGMMQNSPIKFAGTSNTQREGIAFQLIDRDDLDKRYNFISNKKLDFDALSLPEIVDLEVKFVGVPADLATAVTFTVAVEENGDSISGLTKDDVFISKNGTNVAISTLIEDNVVFGKYVATIPALASNDSLVVGFKDSVSGTSIIEVAGYLFQTDGDQAVVL